MAKRRVQPDLRLDPEKVRPKASPVDTFVRPKRSPLRDLAEGLQDFAPAVGRFASQLGGEQREDMEKAGEARMQEIHRQQMTLKQAQDEGLIEQWENPFFRLGMEQQAAEIGSMNYAGDLNREKDEWIKQGVRPEEFREKEMEFRQAWMEENVHADPSDQFTTMFGDALNRNAAAVERRFHQKAGEEMVRETEEGAYTQFSSILNSAEYREGTNREDLIQELTGTLNALHDDMNLDGTTLNKLAVDAVVNYALEAAEAGVDVDAEGILEGILTGPDDGTKSPLGFTKYAETAMRNLNGQMATAEDHAIKWEQSQANVQAREITQDTRQALLESDNPESVDIMPAVERLISIGTPWALQQAEAIRAMPSILAETEMRVDFAGTREFDEYGGRVAAGDLGLAGINGLWYADKISGGQYRELQQIWTQRQNRQAARARGWDPMDGIRSGDDLLEALADTDMDIYGIDDAAADRAVRDLERRWNAVASTERVQEMSLQEKRDEYQRVLEGVAHDRFPGRMQKVREQGVPGDPLAADNLPITASEARSLGTMLSTGEIDEAGAELFDRLAYWGISKAELFDRENRETGEVIPGLYRQLGERFDNLPELSTGTGDSDRVSDTPDQRRTLAEISARRTELRDRINSGDDLTIDERREIVRELDALMTQALVADVKEEAQELWGMIKSLGETLGEAGYVEIGVPGQSRFKIGRDNEN